MRPDTLEILRCPYCGGRLELVDSSFHRREGREIIDGILACHCCVFPVVDGIPVMHLGPAATSAKDQIESGQPDLARRTMLELQSEAQAAIFERAAAAPDATYRALVDALGPNFEGGYFLYRFGDPTFVVAHAVVSAVAGAVLRGTRRAIDVCGGSGHLTRSLLEHSSPAPVLADLYFAKVWLARRFTAPGCEPICCDGNAPLPFARGAFGFAMCSDAFQYIWTKRQLVAELARVVDGDEPGVVVIGHTHNQRQWTHSWGQPLPPEGYRDLFETLDARVYGEAGLFADVLGGGPLDLSRRDSAETLDQDQALTIVASNDDGVFRPFPLPAPTDARGAFQLNPLYAPERDGDRVRLRLRFPSEDYEDEYGAAARQYLADEVLVDRAVIASLPTTQLSPALADLARRRVVLDLPKNYL